MKAVLAAAALVLTPTVAAAHAYLKASDPAAGAVVYATPQAIQLTFTEGIEPAFSQFVLLRAGRAVTIGAPRTSDDGTQVNLPLRAPLRPGTYSVEWHVTAIDTHRTAGRFAFTLRRR